MDALACLIAEREIERAILDYAAWNDSGAWEKVAALYSADGRMSRPTAPDDFIVGREAILAAFLARPPRTTRHICANIRITLDGSDHARADSQILLFTGPDQAPLVGTYADRLVHTADGWRFAERRGSLDFPKP
ncbi:nuclear transport factor 2 family protein [Novosphingobium flavum]|uniref:Nuclear transport factor 2 family protein n=1 Tax=Novosphingobium aerophilum TaxID=2839843 RepID=A0A7X1F6A7_9SPHN|nr:nuclear transport factor 2 family protein [Novosphingobium aerophilum]MBC2651190.1 nuclear transport factor 2 family protein [Novosphingobium aerophilum]MBC2660747.1 nuclear transport factor 2 family protein [Novosphingobium aerophilum]